MKVGITAGVYWPEIGGSATFLHRLRTDLMARGHQVRIVCFGEGGNEPGVIRVSRSLPVPLRILLFTYQALRWLREVDVWFVNDYGLPAVVLKPLVRRPTLMKVIGDWAWQAAANENLIDLPPPPVDPLVDFQSRRQPIRVEARKLLQALLARSMDRVLVPSEYLARIVGLWGIPRGRVEVVYNGVPILDTPRAERDPHLAVTAARLAKWKGVHDLLRAFSALAREVPDARLVVLGDGPERTRLEALALELGLSQDTATFAGTVPRTEVASWLSRAGVFVLPSAYEGLPHVVLEAMAAGCPVVAAAAGGTPEVIRHGEDGLLVPVGGTDALRAALTRVMLDRDLAESLGVAGRARVVRTFPWAATSQGVIELLERMARPG